MFTHVMVGTDDMEKSKQFYDATLGVIGIGPGYQDERGRVFYMSPTCAFGISKPINGEPASHANGGTIGFHASSPEQVDAWHAAGVAAGGVTCEDPPGFREGGIGKTYIAYLRDPAGNKVCAMNLAAS